jgi:hypothetical protein
MCDKLAPIIFFLFAIGFSVAAFAAPVWKGELGAYAAEKRVSLISIWSSTCKSENTISALDSSCPAAAGLVRASLGLGVTAFIVTVATALLVVVATCRSDKSMYTNDRMLFRVAGGMFFVVAVLEFSNGIVATQINEDGRCPPIPFCTTSVDWKDLKRDFQLVAAFVLGATALICSCCCASGVYSGFCHRLDSAEYIRLHTPTDVTPTDVRPYVTPRPSYTGPSEAEKCFGAARVRAGLA